LFIKNEIIYEEGDEVPEMYFITSGSVDIGFMHPTKGFVKVLKFYKNSYIMAFNVLAGSKSDFRYVAAERTEALALEREFLNNVFERFDSIRSKIFAEQMIRHWEIFKKVIKKEKIAKAELIENEMERKAFLAEFDESSMIVNKKKLTDDDDNDLTALLNQKIQTVKN